MKPDFLQVLNIHKFHDDEQTLKGVELHLERGEIFCLLGPSGCGKTTLLRIIAGLEEADQGTIIFDGQDLMQVPPYKRQFSMMFQEFALFPHKNVFENIAFGLRMQKMSEKQVQDRTREMLELIGLEELENRNISELSGGERQRVALARSLAPKPKLLMLDEPMGSLDRALRERLVADLRAILKKIDITVIFVTHDQNEAFVLSDRVAVFNKGFIEQIDTPERLYRNPKSAFIAGFLGFHNLVTARETSKGNFDTPLGKVDFPGRVSDPSREYHMLIRPEAARIVTDSLPSSEDEIGFFCQVEDCRFKGSVYQLQVICSEMVSLVFHLPSESDPDLKPGERLELAINRSAVNLIPD
jgi:thiamine transport system ATP-binding protein